MHSILKLTISKGMEEKEWKRNEEFELNIFLGIQIVCFTVSNFNKNIIKSC